MINTTARERILARALKAMLKWPYETSIWDHIRHHVPPNQNFDPSYIADIADIRAGIRAAEAVGEKNILPKDLTKI